jgi:anaerobic selenocysteine-containing dehydrogenase
MATFHSTRIGTLNIQPRIAGDLALLRGVAKHLLEAARTDPTAIDRQFIDRYTSGFEAYRARVEAVSWDELERQSGVPPAQIRALGVLCGIGDYSLQSDQPLMKHVVVDVTPASTRAGGGA